MLIYLEDVNPNELKGNILILIQLLSFVHAYPQIIQTVNIIRQNTFQKTKFARINQEKWPRALMKSKDILNVILD